MLYLSDIQQHYMKKGLSAIVVALFFIIVSAFAVPKIANKSPKKSIATSSATDKNAALKKWEASPEGKKVLAGAAKIKKFIRDSTNMEGVVTSLSLPPGSRLGFGLMVRINSDDYILAFGPGQSGKNNFNNEFELKMLVIRQACASFAISLKAFHLLSILHTQT